MQVCRDGCTDGKGVILFGLSWDRCRFHVLCPLATLKSALWNTSRTSALISCNFLIQILMLTLGPQRFVLNWIYWNANLASTQRICFWLNLEVEGFNRPSGSVLAGGEGAFLESIFEANAAVVSHKTMDTMPTNTNKVIEDLGRLAQLLEATESRCALMATSWEDRQMMKRIV